MSLLRLTFETPKPAPTVKDQERKGSGASSDGFGSKIQRKIIKFVRDESTTLQELGMDKTVAAVSFGIN